MTPALTRLAHARRQLAVAGAAGPMLVALGVGLFLLVASTEAGRLFQFDRGTARIAGLGLLLAALAIGAAMAWRAWRRTTTTEVALWIERRTPGLQYALVTLADPHAAITPAARERLETWVSVYRWEPTLRNATARTFGRALLAPAVALVLALALSALAPNARERFARTSGGAPGAASTPRGAAAALTYRVRVVPPRYSALPARDVGEASSVAALIGSQVEISGVGAAPTASLAEQRIAASASADRWRVSLVMPAQPVALRLARGAHARIVVLEPRADSAPVLALRLPVRDTVLRAAAGAVALAADARDDLGMTEGRLEYIVSSGEGESFKFRSGALAVRRLGGARAASLAATLDLAALALAPGDIVHLRAVARDANPRGTLAASETRTLRVMRRGEADSVAIEAAPPPEADKSLLSQRMLIRLTEALVARQARLSRADLVEESRRIASDQKRLRRAVGDVVFTRLGEGSAEHEHAPGEQHVPGDEGPAGARGARTPEQVLAAADRATGRGTDAVLDFEGDETPVVAINRPLLEAYNAMWDAALSLDVAEPRAALPPMRRALEAIQRARAAERVYLRGRPPAVIVDLARVRLAGKERGEPERRSPRPAVPNTRARVATRLAAVAVLASREPAAAADSLLLLRVDVLTTDPALARALGDAAEALRRGGDATAALVRARRVAAGGAGAAPAPGAWRGAWSAAGAER